MSVTITLKKSAQANKRPTALSLAPGEIAINYNDTGAGVFFASLNNKVIKVGPAEVGATAPNSSPAGSSGNSVGEFWYDTTSSTLKIWTGTAWASSAVATTVATPTVTGTVYGCSNLTNAFFGYCSGVLGSSSGGNSALGVCSLSSLTTGAFNVGVGSQAASGITTGSCNVAIGYNVQVSSNTGSCQLAIGFGSNYWLTGNSSKAIRPGAGIIDSLGSCGTVNQVLSSTGANTIQWTTLPTTAPATPTTFGTLLGRVDAGNASVGCNALLNLTTGTLNTALGCGAGSGVTTGSRNLALGYGVQVSSSTGNCQLAIGFSGTDCWLSGDSTKAIRPGAGIIDSTGSCGTLNQVLASTGSNSVLWVTPGATPNATPTVSGTLKGCTTITSGGISGKVSLGCNALLSQTTGDRNTAVGSNALCAATTGKYNTAVGEDSLKVAVSGSYNTAVGAFTLRSNTGSYNTAIGTCSQGFATTAAENTSLGYTSLASLTTGATNTAVGTCTLLSMTDGTQNAGFGAEALRDNTSGFNNTAIGQASLISATGSWNTGLGTFSGSNITTGCCNVVLGPYVTVSSPTASCELSIGWSATCNWLTGTSTKAIRPGAGIIDSSGLCGTSGQVLTSTGTNSILWATPASGPQATPTVYGNVLGCTSVTVGTVRGKVALGCNALLSQTVGDLNTAIGTDSMCLTTTGSSNTAIGTSSMKGNVSGSCNVSVGNLSLLSITSGCLNTALGYNAGSAITTGLCNVAIGPNVQVVSGTANGQLAIGWSATCCWLTGDITKAIKPGGGIIDCANLCGTAGQVLSSTGANAISWINLPATPVATPTVSGTMLGCTTITAGAVTGKVALGCNALLSQTTGDQNTAVGTDALCATTSASGNVAVGFSALKADTTGARNTSVGSSSLLALTTGGSNIAVGFCAGSSITTGCYNTIIGNCAGGVTTGLCNVAIGHNVLVTAAGCGQLAIGWGAGCCWLTGDNLRNIRPGATILDRNGSAGTNGQILTTTGTQLQWCTINQPTNATPTVSGTVLGCTIVTVGTTPGKVSLGCNALLSQTSGDLNTAVGNDALCATTTGRQNTAVGFNSLKANTVGQCNTALGDSSLTAATGSFNLALGSNAGCALTTGSCNVAIGPSVQVASATANGQLAIGWSATCCWLTGTNTKAIKPGAGIIDCANLCGTAGQVLSSTGANSVAWITPSGAPQATPTTLGTVYGCTTSPGSVSLGCNAILSQTTGDLNTAVGSCALCSITTGRQNTAIGWQALKLNTGGYNTALGSSAGSTITTGTYNVVIGSGVQVASATGSCQLAIGFGGTNCWLSGDSTKAIRPGAGIIDCAGSCGTAGQFLASNGSNALVWCNSGASAATPSTLGTVYGRTGSGLNHSVGIYSLSCLTTGQNNTAMGFAAGCSITTGEHNTALGQAALLVSTTGCYNTIVGSAAAANLTTGGCNTVVGACAFRCCSLTYYGSIAIGARASEFAYGDKGIAIGFDAARGTALAPVVLASSIAIGACSQGAGTGGTANISIGDCSLCKLSGGTWNVSIGLCSGRDLTSGNANVFIGHCAGGGNTTGCNNIFIGHLTGSGSLNTCCFSTTRSNSIMLGNCLTTGGFFTQIPLTVVSDERSKKIYGDVPLALPFVKSLSPITYQFCNRETGEVQDSQCRYGFSAQNIMENEVDPENPVIANNEDPNTYSVTETMLLPVLVNAIKDLSNMVENLQSQITELEKKIACLGQ